MTDEQKKYLTGRYPTIQGLLNMVGKLPNTKDRLYQQPCPAIEDLNDIYRVNADVQLMQRVFNNIYVLRTCVNAPTLLVESLTTNFLTMFSKRTVDQLLCFIVEYPSLRQYGSGFDYSTFADGFNTFCREWEAEKNRQIAKQQEQEMQSGLRSDGVVGVDALRQYFEMLKGMGVNFAQSPLCKRRGELAEVANAITKELLRDGWKPNKQATRDYYEQPKADWDARVRQNRKRLARKFLADDEVKEFYMEANKPF